MIMKILYKVQENFTLTTFNGIKERQYSVFKKEHRLWNMIDKCFRFGSTLPVPVLGSMLMTSGAVSYSQQKGIQRFQLGKDKNNGSHPKKLSHDGLVSQVLVSRESTAMFVALSRSYKSQRPWKVHSCPRCCVNVDEQFWIFKNNPYNPHHFNCANWEKALPSKEVKCGRL